MFWNQHSLLPVSSTYICAATNRACYLSESHKYVLKPTDPVICLNHKYVLKPTNNLSKAHKNVPRWIEPLTCLSSCTAACNTFCHFCISTLWSVSCCCSRWSHSSWDFGGCLKLWYYIHTEETLLRQTTCKFGITDYLYYAQSLWKRCCGQEISFYRGSNNGTA
jgi:hypothetical protein